MKTYYALQMWGCIEPVLKGPFTKESTALDVIKKKAKADGTDNHSYVLLTVHPDKVWADGIDAEQLLEDEEDD